MLACLGGTPDVNGDGRVLFHCLTERVQVTPEIGVDGRRAQFREGFAASIRVLDLRTLHADMALDEGIDRPLAALRAAASRSIPSALYGLRDRSSATRSQRRSREIGVMSPIAWQCRSASCTAPSEMTVQVTPLLRLSAT